jgi:hypothetical protein
METSGTQLLLDALEQVRRRVRRLGVLLGAGTALTVLATLLLLLVWADYLLNLHALPRLVLTLAALAGAGYALWRWLIVPARAPLSLGDIAGRAEKAFPSYQDRLRSTVDILAGKDQPGSEMMKRRVVSETVHLTQTLDLNTMVLTQPAWKAGAAAAAAVLLLGLNALIMGPHYAHIALDRLLIPFADVAWPRQVAIESAISVPPTVAVGQSLDVAVRLTRGDKASRQVKVFYQYGDENGQPVGPVQQELMRRGGDGLFHAAVDAIAPSDTATGTINIWAESGDGRLALTPVKIVQRLAIQSGDAVVGPPPYAPAAPARHVNLLQDSAVVTPGATVSLAIHFNKALDPSRPVSVEVLTDKAKPTFIWTAPADGVVSAVVSCEQSFRFRLHATDADGLANPAIEAFELVVRPDQNPTVTIERPEQNQDCTPEAVVNLQALAEDDFGFTGLKLAIDRMPQKLHDEIVLVEHASAANGATWTAVDSPPELQRFRVGYAWELTRPGEPHPQPGDVLEYAVAATDNFRLNGQTHPPVLSSRRRLHIISQEAFSTKMGDQMSAVAEQTAALKRGEETAEQQVYALLKRVAARPAPDGDDQTAADRLTQQQNELAMQTAGLASKLADIGLRMRENRSTNHALQSTAAGVADQLSRSAGGAMKEAAQQLTDAGQAAVTAQASRALEAAGAAVARAAGELQAAIDQMSGNENLAKSIQSAQSLLGQQQALSADTAAAAHATAGKSAEELTAKQHDEMQQLAERQAALATAVQKSLDQMADNAAKLTTADPIAAAAMTRASNTGNQQNVPGQQQMASQALQQNLQGEARASQQQAESGLQMMLQKLLDGQQQKLDEEAHRLGQLQNRVAALIQVQAAHNLDNLMLSGQGKLLAGPTERLTLFSQAGRDPDAAPPPVTWASLAGAQEQTAAETRDVAKAAAQGGMSEAADHLIAAADRMDRAGARLNAAEYDLAYQPAQRDALAELLVAKQLIDRHKSAADQDQDEQKKATIRQAYLAIMKQQTVVNQETAAVDAAPRNDDGTLRRIDLLRCRRAATAQAKVIQQTQALDEPLQALGSIVYSWANRDLAQQMSQVHDALNQGDTGDATQARQKQILAQLDSLTSDLSLKKLKPSEEKQKGGGGGGGGGGQEAPPEMPTEAELRLLKTLQIAENGQTAALALRAHPDQAEVAAAGRRQEELRGLLDQLLRKASKGKVRLRSTMSADELLPEERTNVAAAMIPPAGDNGKAGVPPATLADLNDVGKRMIRVRERLIDRNDPGSVTQVIQNHIVDNLETLIQQSRQADAPPPPQSPPTTQPKPRPTSQPDPGASPDNSDSPGGKQMASGAGVEKSGSGEGKGGGDAAENINPQNARLWGDVTPRQRQAVTESGGEKVLDKYKTMVDDYYQTMSARPGGQ